MQCELCGAKIRGQSRTVRIEGAELEVCAQCAKYGTEVQKPGKPQTRRATTQPSAKPPVRKKRDVFDFIEGEIVDDYGRKIRKARMQRGWTQKDLAMEIKEKELLIKKIEKEDLIPEDDVRVKIEKILDIRLIDIPDEQEEGRRTGKIVPTLGDVISIKKVQK
ncbi:MAG TPA: multiprotein bridging factor aMBF1 [Methanoregulaceae archaeon]|nr:multiprotein bridging factor aMBF1 [Methanoregulaceae archaeon]